MKNKTTLILDFDGTIADSLKFSVNFLTKEGKKFGYNLNKKEVFEMIRNQSLKEIIKKYKISKLHFIYFVWKIKKDLKLVTEDVKLFPVMKKLLLELEKKYNLILLTSNDKLHVEKILRKNKIMHCFNEFYYISSLNGKSKYLKKILKNHKLKKGEVVYIGDELRDFNACKKIGIDCINVSHGYNSKKLLETKNSLIVDNVKELRELLIF